MALINCTIDSEQIKKLQGQLEGFSKAKRAVATTRGLVKVAKQGAVQAKRQIADEYNVKKGVIGKRLKGKSIKSMEAIIQVEQRPKGTRMPVISFMTSANKAKKLVEFKVKRTGSATTLRHAFVATMSSGHTGVFQRTDKKLHEVYTIDVTQMFTSKNVRPAVLRKINDSAARVLEHELQYELDKLMRG